MRGCFPPRASLSRIDTSKYLFQMRAIIIYYFLAGCLHIISYGHMALTWVCVTCYFNSGADNSKYNADNNLLMWHPSLPLLLIDIILLKNIAIYL